MAAAAEGGAEVPTLLIDEAETVGGRTELSEISISLGERGGRLIGAVEGKLELSGTVPLEKIELQLLTHMVRAAST